MNMKIICKIPANRQTVVFMESGKSLPERVSSDNNPQIVSDNIPYHSNSNNNYTTSFGAKIKTTGCTDWIKPETLSRWEELAKDIGRDNDTVCLTFGKPKRYKSVIYGETSILDKVHYPVERFVSGKVVLEGGIELRNVFTSNPDYLHCTSRINNIVYLVDRYLNALKDVIRK